MARRRPTAGVPAHLRAALALRGYTAEEFAKQLPPALRISPRTLARILLGERPAEDWEVQAFAEVLEVPEWFLREGLAGAGEGPAPVGDRQLHNLLRRQHENVMGRLDRVDEQLRALAKSADRSKLTR